MQKTERTLRRENPLPEIPLDNAPQEESLAASKPHVAPTDAPKLKTKRNVSAGAKGRKRADKEKGMERAQKLEKRRDSVEGKKDKKKRAKALWE